MMDIGRAMGGAALPTVVMVIAMMAAMIIIVYMYVCPQNMQKYLEIETKHL